MTEIILHVAEAADRHGYFMAWVLTPDGRHNEHVFPHSRQPFLDAARALLKLGLDPATILTMVHAKTGTQSMRGPIGQAAKLTVDENGPRFRKYRAFPAGQAKDAINDDPPTSHAQNHTPRSVQP